MAEPIMRASDYAAAIEDQVTLVRYYRSLAQSRESTERQIAEFRQRAAEFNASADRLAAQLNDAPGLEARAVAEIKRLREGQGLLKVESGLKAVNKLADQLADLDPAALAAVIAQLEKLQGGAK